MPRCWGSSSPRCSYPREEQDPKPLLTAAPRKVSPKAPSPGSFSLSTRVGLDERVLGA